MNGLDVLGRKKNHGQTDVIIVTGHGNEKLSIDAEGGASVLFRSLSIDKY